MLHSGSCFSNLCVESNVFLVGCDIIRVTSVMEIIVNYSLILFGDHIQT